MQNPDSPPANTSSSSSSTNPNPKPKQRIGARRRGGAPLIVTLATKITSLVTRTRGQTYSPPSTPTSTPTPTLTLTDAPTTAFLQHATLDQPSFFAALTTAGFPDMSQIPLAPILFSLTAGPATLVPLPKFLELLSVATQTRTLYHTHLPPNAPGIERHEFHTMVLRFLSVGDRTVFPNLREALHEDTVGDGAALEGFVEKVLNEEAFARYSSTRLAGEGRMDLTELLAFSFAMHGMVGVYKGVVGERELGLTRETYAVALKMVGIGDLERTLQGQFMDSVFKRSNPSRTGVVSFPEFVRAGMSLLYPVAHVEYIRTIGGYPGWNALTTPTPTQTLDPTAIATLISTLHTGDVLLMQDVTSPFGKFVNFSLDSPWFHASVVVRRSPLHGTANTRTEELLQKHPFRRASHQFCSPGYCRCHDPTPGDFPPSRFTGLGEVGLLESTGEGIHIYDLAHRIFESGEEGRWTTIAIARLHDAPGRDDTERINGFLEEVRGGLYSVAKDELKAAISFRREGSGEEVELPEGQRGTDDFCAGLVQGFYHHMGWVDLTRPVNSVMPSDYDVGEGEAHVMGERESSLRGLKRCPVEILEGQGWLGPLELVVCPDLGAKLPLKLPKKKV